MNAVELTIVNHGERKTASDLGLRALDSGFRKNAASTSGKML
jgi:hypothetical protein